MQVLGSAHQCAVCGAPVLQCGAEFVRFDVIFSYHRVPLLFRICNQPHPAFARGILPDTDNHRDPPARSNVAVNAQRQQALMQAWAPWQNHSVAQLEELLMY